MISMHRRRCHGSVCLHESFDHVSDSFEGGLNRGVWVGLGTQQLATFDDGRCLHQLMKEMPPWSLPTFDTSPDHRNVLDLLFTLRTAEHHHDLPTNSFPIERSFSIHNPSLKELILGLVKKHFIAPTHNLDEASDAITSAVLIGGLLHLFCSTIIVEEHVEIWHNGTLDENNYSYHALGVQFRILILNLLNERFADSFRAIAELSVHMPPNIDGWEAFEWAIIVYDEVSHFERSLGSGELSLLNHFSNDLKVILLETLHSVRAKLATFIRRCYECFPIWRNHPRVSRDGRSKPAQIIALTLNLQKYKSQLQASVLYAPLGSGDVYLLSKPDTPLLQAPRMSRDIEDSRQFMLNHVSRRLSILDTRQETSDIVWRGLFPGLRHIR